MGSAFNALLFTPSDPRGTERESRQNHFSPTPIKDSRLHWNWKSSEGHPSRSVHKKPQRLSLRYLDVMKGLCSYSVV